MKVTVTFEMSEMEDGETASLSFTKEGIEYLEHYLHMVGRSARAVGWDSIDTLTATHEQNQVKFVGKF